MLQLNLPPYPINIRTQNGRQQIYDVLRRRFVALTAEEWVRQHFVHFLSSHLGYPLALMQNEVRIPVGNKTLRADTVIYDRLLRPRVIVEYKAPSIELTEKVFNQVADYNQQLQVGYIMMSNGLSHVAMKLDKQRRVYRLLADLPQYKQLED